MEKHDPYAAAREDLIPQLEHLASEDESIDRAKRRLVDALDDAVETLVHLARHSDSERMRFEVSRYIVERLMGKVGATVSEPWQRLFQELQVSDDVPEGRPLDVVED